MKRIFPHVIFIALFASLATFVCGQEIGLRAPQGFEVSLYADDQLAHDIFSMTIDSHGRITVAGRDYVKTLHDDNQDGRADRATLFSKIPKSGAHGMVFDGADLICTGDNSLLRLRDSDGDGRADGKPIAIASLRHLEHGANGVAIGPDGWIYVICGNDANASKQHVSTAGSPVENPLCGAVVRFSPDGRQREVLAHGFRNPYDLAFNAVGHLFTVDADGERDQYMPWYSPTRLFDIAPGMHHGWMLHGWQRSWNRPESYFDNVNRLVEVGRGSPTGVAAYRHRQFPQAYQEGVFSCCWTLGRVYFYPLVRQDASYKSRREIFLETTGDVGFAPVDIAIGPAGDMFVAIGGRRTRGGVFRIRYVGSQKDSPPNKPNRSAAKQSDQRLEWILSAPQPLAAWSRARWTSEAKNLGGKAFAAAAANPSFSISRRIRAVEILVDLFDGLSINSANQTLATADAALTARVAWALSRKPRGPAGEKLLARLTHHENLHVARAAWEALAALGPLSKATDSAAWEDLYQSKERRIRSAILAADVRRKQVELIRPSEDDPGQLLAYLWRLHWRGRLDPQHTDLAARIFLSDKNPQHRTEAIRLVQLALGDILAPPTNPDVLAGYSLSGQADDIAETMQRWGAALAEVFPTGDESIDHELARLLAMMHVENDACLERITSLWSPQSRVENDIHYLICLSQLGGARSSQATSGTASALANLHHKMTDSQMAPSRNWPLRVGEAFHLLLAKDNKLAQALIKSPKFNLPQQSLFAARMEGQSQLQAVRCLLQASKQWDDETRWTAELVSVAAKLPPEESLAVLRRQWDDFTLRGPIVSVLAPQARQEDRPLFLEALSSAEAQTIQLAAEALHRIGGKPSTAELTTAASALQRYCKAPQDIAVRKALAALLTTWTGQQFNIKESKGAGAAAAYQVWFDYLAKTHPAVSRRLQSLAGGDQASWLKRLKQIDWNAGQARPGKTIFEKRACFRCHGGDSRLGPDLAGAAGRFSREDLFTAILSPNQNVSPLYQTTQVLTSAGKIYHGLIVYESPEATLVQTSPDVTIRIAGDEIISMQPSRLSLMPQGLLQGAEDKDLADLYAYLKTLRGKQ